MGNIVFACCLSLSISLSLTASLNPQVLSHILSIERLHRTVEFNQELADLSELSSRVLMQTGGRSSGGGRGAVPAATTTVAARSTSGSSDVAAAPPQADAGEGTFVNLPPHVGVPAFSSGGGGGGGEATPGGPDRAKMRPPGHERSALPSGEPEEASSVPAGAEAGGSTILQVSPHTYRLPD